MLVLKTRDARSDNSRGLYSYYESNEVSRGAPISVFGLIYINGYPMAMSRDEHSKRGKRRMNTRSWYLPPFKDQRRVDSTRIWQIKAKLNYGRY